MTPKRYKPASVYEAAKDRIRLVFNHFPQVCVAFSGGKDSSVLLHLTLEIARELQRPLVDVLFIDLEGQYRCTINHVREMLDLPMVRPWWICLPLNLRNASSCSQPYWCCWDPDQQAKWIRPLPQHRAVISNPDFFNFYRHRMEFEEFVHLFNAWLSRETPTGSLVGIRADESLNRFMAVKPNRRTKKSAWTAPHNQKAVNWSSKGQSGERFVTFFPIYDWRFSDIWHYTAINGNSYNRIYDRMLFAGVPYSQMRICQPYGDDQRRGLDLFQKLEPTTWERVEQRVFGANYGARYCRQQLLGYRGGLGLPEGMSTWRDYCTFLISSLPSPMRDVYERRILVFIHWWESRGYPLSQWPDAGIPKLENRKTQPSWRRIALSLLKQDMARSLSFGQAKCDAVSLSRNSKEPE